MTQKTEHYNLLEEDWIPVLWTDGGYSRVGIIEALTQAGRIRQIASPNPMSRIAIVRFLLALLYWCRGNPTEGRASEFHSSFPETWFSKLKANRDLFCLFGEEKRFYQFLPSKNAKKLSANYLIHEIPTGINKRHFRHSTDGTNGLCAACCAEGLLRLPMFATSGGRGKPPGINAKPPFYAMPQGTSLAATLRLSWLPTSNQGLPAWERPDLELPKTGVVPILIGLTWLPRRVWLDNAEDCSVACISCGRRDRLVRMCVFEGIGSTKTDADEVGRTWQDPHVILTDIAKGSPRPLSVRDALGASDAACGQWATIVAGMIQDQESRDTIRYGIQNSGAEGKHIEAWIVGFSTVQNDKYLETREYLMPYSFSQPPIANKLEQIDRWQKESRRIGKQLAGIVGGKVKGDTTISSIRHNIEERVLAKAQESGVGKDGTWNQAAQEYKTIMVSIAKSLSPGFTATALLKRVQIAGLKPNMSPKEKEGKQAKGSKGGDA